VSRGAGRPSSEGADPLQLVPHFWVARLIGSSAMLATALARELRLPVVARDLIKETLMDHFVGAERVGTAAFALQFAIARAVLDSGSGLMLEGASTAINPN
jgi:hypothetical protein